MTERFSAVLDPRGPSALWDTWTDYPRNLTIHALFEEQARLRPQATALVFGDRTLTYGELNERANRVATRLQGMGVGPDVLVGICLERSLDLIVALLAILKAGGAYMPFDSNYPKERLEFMLADSQAHLIITSEKLRAELFGDLRGAVTLSLDELWQNGMPAADLVSAAGPRHLAYVMYTSGSTGKPKGVQVEHRSVVRLVKNTNYCQFGPEEVFLQLAPVSFDASTLEIWGALLNGSRLVIMPPHTPSLAELGCAIRNHQVTTAWLTAGLFHLMVDQRLEDLCTLRQLLAGGDVLSAPHVRKVLEAAPSCTVINGYGPTEGTTFTCCHVMRAGDPVPDAVPIGKPISNTQVYILDEELQAVPEGEPGELYIGGDGLARDYLSRPELTAEKFIPNPFSEDPDGRLYRSGDLARYRNDGTVEFLGRFDNQVKVNGYRIELGEIETVLQQHPGVRQVVVATRADSPGEKRLVAYAVSGSENSTSVPDLREYLQTRLPHYMLPSTFVMMESLPLTPNGKVDRAALPAPGTVEPQPKDQPGQPLDGLEQTVASIWRKILGNPNVGLDDNFFDLGGDSLMLMEAHAQLQKTVADFDLSIVDLFEFATIRSLVRHLGSTVPSQPSFSEAEERARKQKQALAAQKQRRVEQYS